MFMEKILSKDKRIQIAREELENFEMPHLPSLEEIAWAFPVAGPTNLTTQKNNGQYFNIQDVNAWRVLLLLQNYNNTLQGSLQGDVNQNEYPVSHTSFRDPFEILDVTHLSPMFPDFVRGVYDKEMEESGRPSRGYFWENIPREILQGVKRIHDINWNTQHNEEDTRYYLSNVRNILNEGSRYLTKVVENSSEANEWPQLTKASVDDLKNGSYFQIVLFGRGRAGLKQGVSMGVSGDKLTLRYSGRDEPVEYNLNEFRDADPKLWTIK